jgi:transcriptional regulator with XRE-family HTH domain
LSKLKNINDKKAEKQGFGKRLHQALGNKSYKETARLLKEIGINIDYDSLRRYILEERKPDVDLLVRLASASDVSLDWLIKGTDEQSDLINSKKLTELSKELNDSIWSELTCGDLKALKKLASINNTSIQKTTRDIIVQGISLFGVFERPQKINFLSLSNYPSEDLCEIDQFGEIGDEDELIKAVETVRVPKKIVSWISEDTARTFSQRDIHAYKVTSKRLRQQKIHEGDIVVAANFNSIGDAKNWFYDSYGFVIQPNERKIILRRVYDDFFKLDGFFLSPLYANHPIERNITLKIEDLEFILAIVTP